MPKLLIAIVFASFGLSLTVPEARALTVGLNLSDDAAEFKFARTGRGGMLQTEFNWLHEQDNGDVVSVGLHMVDDANPGGPNLDVGIGGRLMFVDPTGPLDGVALGVGGYFRYTIPTMNRLGIGGELYHAPSIVSGGDLERYTQWAIRGEYQVLRQANIYIGYRRVRPDFGGGAVTLESGLHAGLRLNF
ncbi:YfaZ family outer membrane protein [Natronospira bacteriovora]|uniref:YfaZ family outer membrane protein n=1 Tax=Natronospira bacteriovora TaxID=3069753 RepID=A0ABU0W3B7_9GAMM|nr:YfaZ family outer membrane protein [Natronospira sp. AB-CW4]MDQ2068516.1 YfaZ family outer membrane protein [Natronospira sp. AB-CW4]